MSRKCRETPSVVSHGAWTSVFRHLVLRLFATDDHEPRTFAFVAPKDGHQTVVDLMAGFSGKLLSPVKADFNLPLVGWNDLD